MQLKKLERHVEDIPRFVLGEGTMLYVVIILSRYSSQISDIKSVHILEPVLPPSE